MAPNSNMSTDLRTEEVIDQTAIDMNNRSHSLSVSDSEPNPVSVVDYTSFSPQIKPHPTKSVAYITVSDPVTFNEGLKGKYTLYRVAYDPELEKNESEHSAEEPFLSHPSSTQHRYSSFVTLYNLLAKEKPGTVLPPLPDKFLKDRFSATSCEERRGGLELFMRRLTINPELRTCGVLKSFFDDASWRRVKKGEEFDSEADVEEEEVVHTTPKTSKKSTIKKWIKDKKTCLSGTLHRSPLDPLFDEMDHYVTALENGLRRVEMQAEYMVKSLAQEATISMEFGLSCDAVAHVDDFIGNRLNQDTGSTVGQTFHTTSQTADALSALQQKHHQTLLVDFLLPLRDHLKMIHAAKLALTKRSNRRITYSTALSNVDNKKGALHKYRITQGMESKVMGAESSLSKAELEVENAKRNYDDVSERVLREFDRFRYENGTMMHATMVEFGRVQMEYSAKVARIWSSQEFDKEISSSGRCYVDAAKVLMDANRVVGGGHIVDMPMQSPPPVPAETAVSGLANGMETLGIQGAVRYRDSLPEM